MPTRRDTLKAALAAPLAASAAAQADDAVGPGAPDLDFLAREPLLNRDRATHFMAREGLDAIVATHPANVFYLSNHWPLLDQMGWRDSIFAVVPRDPARPVAVVMSAFSYYYSHSSEAEFDNRAVYPYTGPAEGGEGEGGGAESARPVSGFRVAHPERLSPRERRREAALGVMQPPAADAARALAGALVNLGLGEATIGIDDDVVAMLLAPHLPKLSTRPAENTLRRIRLVKSPAELRLMRLAAQQNVDAAMAAARSAREAGSTRALRTRFWTEAARRGNTGVFMVVDGDPSEIADEPLRDGMAFLIDCVSHCRHYHGDLGRTVFVGEPHADMRRACEGIATAWREIQQRLKPGLRFADIPAIGREAIRKQGLDLVVGFNPHSVGLFHTDHPAPSRALRGSVDGLVQPEPSLVVEEGMVLSIDCPVLEAGLGGTAHLEDLVYITATGAEPIHTVPEPVIIV